EIGALHALADTIELVLWTLIAGPVAAVVGEPKLLGGRVPVEADRISDPARDDLHAGTVGAVTPDLPALARIDLADVAVGANLHIELVVGTKRDVFPIMMDLGREAELVGEFDRFADVVELVLDIVVAINPVDREHIERAVLEGEPVGLR